MSGAPWLTVVMPVHDGSRWIEETLQSIARERDPGIEIVLIDSSADQATCDRAAACAGALDIQILQRPDLKPWTAKTNLGVQLARAEWIVLLHQDDVWKIGRASALRRWIAQYPGVALHLAPSEIIGANSQRIGTWRCPLPVGLLPRDTLMERLVVQNFISVPAPLIRRSAWLDCGGMDEALWYTADWDLWLKLSASGVVCYHDEVTTGFRVHGASLTMSGSRDRAGFREQMQTVLDRHIGSIPAGRIGRIGGPARISIAVNAALADAAGGNMRGLVRAAASLIRLGPIGLARYLRYSRIADRLWPRLRAKLAGGL